MKKINLLIASIAMALLIPIGCSVVEPNYPSKEKAKYKYVVYGLGFTDTLYTNSSPSELKLHEGGCIWDKEIRGYRFCNIFKYELIN